MSEEKNEQCRCFCESDCLRKFIIVAFGTFVGAYLALSLFVVARRLPVPSCQCEICPSQIEHYQDRYFDEQMPPIDYPAARHKAPVSHERSQVK